LNWILEPGVERVPILAFEDLERHVFGQSLNCVSNIRGIDALDLDVGCDLEASHVELLFLARGKGRVLF
jgi:hypothetical protein